MAGVRAKARAQAKAKAHERRRALGAISICGQTRASKASIASTIAIVIRFSTLRLLEPWWDRRRHTTNRKLVKVAGNTRAWLD